MKQATLFDAYTEPRTQPIAVARNTDPETSHIAAAQVESSGTAASHRVMIRSYVLALPGRTAGEIAKALGLPKNDTVSKRVKEIPEIEYGPKRRCKVNGTAMQTLWPKGEVEQ